MFHPQSFSLDLIALKAFCPSYLFYTIYFSLCCWESIARNTSLLPTGTAYTKVWKNKQNDQADLTLLFLSCCYDYSLLQQFLQLRLHILNECMEARIQQKNTQNGLQVTFCQMTVVVQLRQT